MARTISKDEAGSPDSRSTGGVTQLYKPTAQESALLLLELIKEREKETKREATRLRIAEISLKRLWGRRRISPEFVEEVAEWLAGAGVTLFYTGTTYALVRTNVVESWSRVTSKRLNDTIEQVAQGTYDFTKLHYLLAVPKKKSGEDEEREL